MSNIFQKLITAVINKVAQNSVKEIDDKMTSCDELKALCRQAIAESCVLLKNNGVLPLNDKKIALFGRCQIDTFFVGYGSGGDVKPPYRVSILDGLRNNGANLNESVAQVYEKWTKRHKPDNVYWGHWPMHHDEMPLKDEFVKTASQESDVAVVVIGRSAGEDRESVAEKGSWYLTDEEEILLRTVRKYFKEVCVIINSGSIMDIAGLEKHNLDAIMFVWQGGQETGNGIADVLLGQVSPCGKLTDTLAKIEDYPSTSNFGNKEFNNYVEDIYVGYRYFNTFAKDKIIYPFGYGLSYTQFKIANCKASQCENICQISFDITNIGKVSGRQVLQIYLSAPQGLLGKPALELAAYAKTKNLKEGETQQINLTVDLTHFASYDDSGVTGNKNCFVLEKGEYKLYAGENLNDAKEFFAVTLKDAQVVKQCQEACAPIIAFDRIINKGGLNYEKTPVSTVDLRERVLSNLPSAIKPAIAGSIDFKDVIDNKVSIDEFIAHLTPDELEELTRGSLYMMYSPLGPKGNAGTMGASSDPLFIKGVPALSTNDGPSGARLQAHSTLLPNGVALASTFDDNLVEKICSEFGKEVYERKSHILLAPGINIHRNPLCGRNFEYFSEDPYLTGRIATAFVKGVQSAGISATPKHFACNGQEKWRVINDSRVSQRALREIYLKGFETCIKEAKPDCLMTSYNKLNGVYSYYNYQLNTTILRDDWGFEGCVMTDWWMREGKSEDFKKLEMQAYRVRAQVDVFMPGAANRGKFKKKVDGSLLASLNGEDGITLGEIQRTARNVLKLCKKHYNDYKNP